MGQGLTVTTLIFALLGFVIQGWNLMGTGMGKSKGAHKTMGFAVSRTKGTHDYTLDYDLEVAGSKVAGTIVASSETEQNTWYGINGVWTSADVRVTFPLEVLWALGWQLMVGNHYETVTTHAASLAPGSTATTAAKAAAAAWAAGTHSGGSDTNLSVVEALGAAQAAGAAAVAAGTAAAEAQAAGAADAAAKGAAALTAKTAAETAATAASAAVGQYILTQPDVVAGAAAETAWRTALNTSPNTFPLKTEAELTAIGTALVGARATIVALLRQVIDADAASASPVIGPVLPAGSKVAAGGTGGSDLILTLPGRVEEQYVKHADNVGPDDEWKKCADAVSMLQMFAYLATIAFIAAVALCGMGLGGKGSGAVRGGVVAFAGLLGGLNLLYFQSTCGAQKVPDYVKNIQKSEWGNYTTGMVICAYHCLVLGVANIASGDSGESANMATVVNEDLYQQ